MSIWSLGLLIEPLSSNIEAIGSPDHGSPMGAVASQKRSEIWAPLSQVVL